MLRPLNELRKVPENQLTAEEKLAVFGPGNYATMRYRQVRAPDGAVAIVQRTFGPGERWSDDWKDSPADFGVVTHPSRDQRDDAAFDDIVATVPPAAAAEPPRARKAAG